MYRIRYLGESRFYTCICWGICSFACRYEVFGSRCTTFCSGYAIFCFVYEIKPFSSVEGAEIGEGCTVGPFARIRPGTVIGKNSRVGNYVEIKASIIGDDTKISHLAYIGDAHIGNHVNIGAGVITCNFDGKRKHQTYIGDHAFVGSNSALVAPLEVQEYAFIGAGSTISRNVNSGELVVERGEIRRIKNRRAPKNERKSQLSGKSAD